MRNLSNLRDKLPIAENTFAMHSQNFSNNDAKFKSHFLNKSCFPKDGPTFEFDGRKFTLVTVRHDKNQHLYIRTNPVKNITNMFLSIYDGKGDKIKDQVRFLQFLVSDIKCLQSPVSHFGPRNLSLRLHFVPFSVSWESLKELRTDTFLFIHKKRILSTLHWIFMTSVN